LGLTKKKNMKKLFIATILVVLGMGNAKAQDGSFGVSAGYGSQFYKLKASFEGDSDSDSESVSGFYIGLFKEFDVNEIFTIRPEFQYARYSKDGESGSQFQIPVMFKVKVAKAFSLMGGPQLDFILDNDTEDINNLVLDWLWGLKSILQKRFLLILDIHLECQRD